ncbi:MAG: extensin [Thermoprotei archaeon]|nr:MAG: extensin [Thermoprotei archaeon]
MYVEELDIPENAIRHLLMRGIQKLFPPQEQAIEKGVLKRKSLVVCSPTASGKTLIAEIAALKHILDLGGKVLYLTPLRALANEKFHTFSQYETLGIKVALSTGDYDSDDPWLGDYDWIITTNEKADSLLRHKAGWLRYITLVVADEIHLIRDSKRGPTLEMVLAKLRKVISSLQILALSATIRNAEELAEWLNADLVKTEWRPVILREGVYFSGDIFFSDNSKITIPESYPNPLDNLVVDCLNRKGQVLVFAGTRGNAVSYARRLADKVKRFLTHEDTRYLVEKAGEILSVEKNRITESLAEYMQKGVAFHHAGLSYRTRKIIEDAFRNAKLKVVCATPTLAAGVNLPARRVVIASYRRYNPELGYFEPIPVLEYKQMAGRAGRPQYDKYGEAILIARTIDELDYLMENYIYAKPERIFSQMASERILRTHILASIASDFASNKHELQQILKFTFYAHQFTIKDLVEIVNESIEYLHRDNLVSIENGKIKATPLGKRISQLYIDIETATTIIKGLKRKEKATPFAYLHLIALTPDIPKLHIRRREIEKYEKILDLRASELFVEEPIGEEEYKIFLSSIKTAKLLEDWINEISDDQLIISYDVGPGDIYAITQTAEWLVYSASELAKELGFYSHVANLLELRQRVKYGVKSELLEIIKIKGIGRVRARILYENGYRNLDDLSKASLSDLSRLPLIGPKLAKSIKEYLAGLRDEVFITTDREVKIEDYF